jgi:hypothetical protein
MKKCYITTTHYYITHYHITTNLDTAPRLAAPRAADRAIASLRHRATASVQANRSRFRLPPAQRPQPAPSHPRQAVRKRARPLRSTATWSIPSGLSSIFYFRSWVHGTVIVLFCLDGCPSIFSTVAKMVSLADSWAKILF